MKMDTERQDEAIRRAVAEINGAIDRMLTQLPKDADLKTVAEQLLDELSFQLDDSAVKKLLFEALVARQALVVELGIDPATWGEA